MVISHYENGVVPGYNPCNYVLIGHIRRIEAKKTKKKIRIVFHAQHFDFCFLQGEKRRNPCSLTVDASNSIKTASNQKMLENIPQLFFNSALETGLTL